MLIKIKTLKRLILCIKQITDSEIKEYYEIFKNVDINILLNYISMLKYELLILRMFLIGLNITFFIKKFKIKNPLNYIELNYENCNNLELEYIINFFNFIIINNRNANCLKMLLNIKKIDKDKYFDILLLKKAKNGKNLSETEKQRLFYLLNIFEETRINYIIKDKEFMKIFNKKPISNEVYQEIDETTNDKYLYWSFYVNVFR